MARTIKLFIGLNDKDTKEQIWDQARAIQGIGKIIKTDHTVYTGYGQYTHKNKTVVQENTIIIEILDFDGSMTNLKLKRRVNKIKKLLNQESVGIQIQEVACDLW